MMYHMRFLALFMLILVAGISGSDELALSTDDTIQGITARGFFDWQDGNLQLRLVSPVDFDRGTPAAQVYSAQQRAEDLYPRFLFESLLSIQVNSRYTVGELLRENPILADSVVNLSQTAHRGLPQPAANLKSITINYTVPIFPELAALFVTHRIPFYMPSVLEWVPTREFTGLVIYAAAPLPLHGTNRSVLLEPALLPEIFDTEMRPVLEQDMLDPEYAVRWGVVAYTETPDEESWQDRIGNDPLRIMARGIFGVDPTDIVIGVDDANRLLALPANQKLLREGRILVILASGQATAD